MRTKLTKRLIDGALPSATTAFLWDEALPGFGVKIEPSGHRTFVLQYSHGDRSRRLKLGRVGDLTLDEARREAQRLRGQVALGRDPGAERTVARQAPTLRAFAERYLSEHARLKKRPRSVLEDERNLRLHLLPVLGARKVIDVDRADVARLHSAMSGTPIAANRCLALLSHMLTMAERWDLRPVGSNPARGVQHFRERHRTRFLSDAELGRLGLVLAEAEAAGEHPSAIAALRLLLLTGARRNEILMLKWQEVDLDRRCLRLPESKTGPKTIPLGAAALELLSNLPRIEGNPYVLPGERPGRPYNSLQQAWARLRQRAGLVDVHLHDLRHSFAALGAGAGESLLVLGALLGHTGPQMTARYAHLADDPLRSAADRIAGRVAAALSRSTAEDVPTGGDQASTELAQHLTTE